MDCREFLIASFGGALLTPLRVETPAQRVDATWDAGQVRHLLPTVSDTRMLIKASFARPLASPPILRIGSSISVRGRMSDTAGECWQFEEGVLAPGRRYRLALFASDNRALCQPWELSTFPAPTDTPERCRVLFFTCAGGPESASLTAGNLPTAVRNRLLRRALSFQPQAAVANGDHVYWDLHQPRVAPDRRNNARLDSFNQLDAVFGKKNEDVLKQAAAPQIVPVYGTDFRSTPTFFLQDDHDYFDNDEGTDEIVTFPPPWFQLELARATQQMYYPEFLSDLSRPAGLPWSSADRQISESFGTLRYGRLVEVLLYDVRRTMTLAGPSAVFVDPRVEHWLKARTEALDTTHLVHAPSNPFGWSAGKWGEWYPDVLGDNGKLTTAVAKPYWQPGWLAQHDRLVASLTAMKGRIPLMVSGDLHSVAVGRMLRSGQLNLGNNPVTTVIAGPIGTSPAGWTSAFRGVGATVPAHLDVREEVAPLEQHGFTLADFLPDRIVLRFFKWDVRTQPPEAIDTLEAFHTMELGRR